MLSTWITTDSSKRRLNSSRFGFTLVELLVSITIMGILLGLGIAEYMRFNHYQLLTQVANGVRSDLRLAQGKAVSGEIPEGCGFLPLDGYEVEFYSSGASDYYIIRAVCQPSKKIDIKKVSLPEGLVLTVPSVNPILFKVLGLGTNIPDPTAGPGETNIGVQGFQTMQLVTVLYTGDIR
jgi:prepilin-type N-terminal cleavage/methylation domain-containing protein